MREFIQLALAFEVVVLIHVGAMALAGWVLGARPKQVNLGFGKEIGRGHLGRVPVVLRLIPTGGSVQFHSSTTSTEEAPSAERTVVGTHTWDELSLSRRVAVQVAGCVALLAVALVALGPSESMPVFGGSFQRLLAGAAAPFAIGAPLVGRWLQALLERGFLEATALLGLVAAAYNLLPIPLLNGGQIIWEVFRGGRQMPSLVAAGGAAFNVLLLASWSVAILAALR